MKMEDPAAESEIEEETTENTVQKQPLASTITPLIQGKDSKKENPNSTSIQQQLGKGGGQPLDKNTRSFMENRFGADFSSVRVHTDDSAVQMNKDIGAQAFTHGQNIYYGKGKSPGKNELTAHELTHTIQQSGGEIQQSQEISRKVIESEESKTSSKSKPQLSEDWRKSQSSTEEKQANNTQHKQEKTDLDNEIDNFNRRSREALRQGGETLRKFCEELFKLLEEKVKIVAKRYEDLLRDEHNLYRTRPVGEFSWRGHQRRFRRERDFLGAILKFLYDHCPNIVRDPARAPILEEAEELKDLPVPQTPANVMTGAEILEILQRFGVNFVNGYVEFTRNLPGYIMAFILFLARSFIGTLREIG
ncbi:MAG: DUF4157 domain-containing protein [Cyanobacteriota bacterium]|nr:DUF4157 domain-containing protein [Cyanobacteriota bacterium]